jgi:hypothetical protein
LLWHVSRAHKVRVLLTTFAVPAFVIAGCFLAWLAFYFWRVTGSPFVVPHVVEARTYSVAPNFLWQSPTPRTFTDPVVQDFYGRWALAEYRKSLGLAGVLAKVLTLFRFYFAYILAVPLLMAVPLVRDKKLRPLWIAAGIFVAGIFSEVWMQPHYVAPAIVLIYAAIVQGLRYWSVWPSRTRSKGFVLPLLLAVVCVLMLFARIGGAASFPPQETFFWDSWPVALRREAIVEQLQRSPGNDLVLVHYTPAHDPHREWVYNAADIENAPIIWAREISPAADAELVARYGHGRRLWRLAADATPPALQPYMGAPGGPP